MKRTTISFICMLVLVLVSACGGSERNLPETEMLTCSVRVLCDEALKKADILGEEKAALLPESGVILDLQQVHVQQGETAFSVLLRKLQEEKIHYDSETLAGTEIRYVSAIGNLYEFDCGEMSGWTYTVNGESPDCSADAYEVKDGDAIEWKYITSFETES